VRDSSTAEFAAEEFAEWVAVVDAEAVVCGGGEASVVLVEGELKKRRRRRRCGGGRRGLRLGRHKGIEIKGLRLIRMEIRVGN